MSLGLIETEIKLIKMKYDKELDYLKFQIQLAELKFKQELSKLEQRIKKTLNSNVKYKSYCYNPMKID